MKRECRMAKTNHGSVVSQAAHDAQNARMPGEAQGIGHIISEIARGDHGPASTPDFTDGVVTVINADGTKAGEFATFADALAQAGDGSTLEVGAGTYKEAISLKSDIHIVGESGAILDGSGIATTAGTQATVQLFSGFSGGSISGLDIVAVQGGGAVQSIIGETISDVSLQGNTFDAGSNELGSVVYFNPTVTGVTLEGNTFEGSSLTGSPLLGIEADNVQVTQNTFGDTAGTYASVEIFAGADGSTSDVVLVGNTGLTQDEISIA